MASVACGRLEADSTPASESWILEEAEFAKRLELGHENARVMELATNHCRHMRFVESGGRGMLEDVTGLPLNMRRVECPVAIGNTSGMRLDHLTFDFYAEHCGGCEMRSPTGRLPNLETEAHARRERAAVAEAEEAEALRLRVVARAERSERRRSLRAMEDPVSSGILDDLDVLDPDPAADGDLDATKGARRRLTTIAGRASDRFDLAIIDELFDLVEKVGVSELLEPLRHLASQRPELGDRLVTAALAELRSKPSIEAGRCLTDHASLIDPAAVDGAVIWSAVALAGSKTSEDHHFSGPTPVVQANDPGPLRVLADLAREAVVERLAAMLPRPVVTSIIMAPHHRPHPVSDFDRRAAAGAIEHLASTHLEVALELLPNLAVSLGVPPEDSYDPGTVGTAERALGRMLVASPARVVEMLEDAGKHASEKIRDGLVGAVRDAVDMVDTEYVHRRAHDPVTNPEVVAAVSEAAFAFLLARTDESWGHGVTFSAAEAIERMGRWHGGSLSDRLDATLGAFVTLTRQREKVPSSALTSTAPPDPLAGMEEWSRKNTLYQSARRLLSAVESASGTDPLKVIRTVTALITNERDNDLGTEVVVPLLATLGEVGSQHGDQPGVLQASLPTLHTYLVDTDPGSRSAALKAWTTIGGRHALPSTVADLLPALIGDTYVVVIDAVLDAARQLSWTVPEARAQLALYANRVIEGIDVTEHLETFLAALGALRSHVSDPHVLSVLEKRALTRVPAMEWHQATKLTDQPWQPDARVAPELAALWLALAPRSTYGWRQRDEAEEALNGLLDCGAGLLGLPAADIIDIGARHSPESHYGSMEYAEVLARAERRHDVVTLLHAALERVPHEPARGSQRALTALALAFARLQVTVGSETGEGVDSATVGAAIDDVGAAIADCLGHSEDDLRWLWPFAQAAAVRAAIICELLDVPTPRDVTAAVADTPTERGAAHQESTDPAEKLTSRAKGLRALTKTLRTGGRSTGTATHTGVTITAQLLDSVAQLLDAEAADLNADLAQAAAHRTAAHRRAGAVDLAAHRDDDPLLPRAHELHALLVAPTDMARPPDVKQVLAMAAALPAPLLFIRAPQRGHAAGPWRPPADPEPDSPTVAVALVSIDDKLLTGPAVVDPGLTHTLSLQVQTDPWPAWAQRLDSELISTLNDTELQRPVLTWQRHEHTDDPNTYEGSGTLHVRYAVPTTQHAPPVLIRLTWRGVDEDGKPRNQPLDVAGHREFRVRPYDSARDASTQYEVFDEHLLAIYEKLAAAGYPHNQLQAFARLLNAISRAGLAMTWNKKYRRGQYVKERQFHDDLHAALLADPTLGGRVERGTALAHGFLDTRHDGITAELKVARDQPVTPQSATKYIGQPTQYAAADGTRLSILVILDMSRKVLPVGTPENYLFVLGPKQHGMTNPHSPNVVVTLVINGNLPVPSSWSRRKNPTADTP
ncbi:hypothetical protein Ais01nite_21750 [Asanoa ishikariensis]|uniref:Uncharacterized protein n=1 Tax=Asanoa ishikariensis TaxID=137265 RepID=A0A1H3U7F6_9ACTN|nr:hypothetical protein Ais01nite_21750 [Asanoa ishikariensis]SDZ58360.1 hypothetical protein SAMN05421684_6699 [Asanoa ishikariensis]